MSGVGKLRGTYAKSEERRREILEAALEVFAVSGFRSGSIRDVAERVGMSEAGLLYHFPTKNVLLTAVLDERDEIARRIVPSGDDGLATVLGLVTLAEYNMTIPGVVELFCVLSAEATAADHPAHDYFVQRYEAVRSLTGRAFEIIAAGGLLRDGIDPEAASRNIIALMDGLQVQWLLDRNSVDMPEEIRQFIRGVLTVDI